MSCWTHITGCISIDTFKTMKRSNLKSEIKRCMKKAPKITGSEKNAEIFVNIPSGSSFWTSHDCDHCKYKDTSRTVTENGEEYEECDGPTNYDCSGEYQTRAVISIQGDLRDRMKDETEEEFNAFLEYVKKMYSIRDYSVNIEGD